MLKHIIFDVDGTIIDTEMAMLKSLQKVLADEERFYALEDLTFALGIPGKETLKRLNIENIDRVHAIWSNAVLQFLDDIVVFEEIEGVLHALKQKGYVLSIVTSKTVKQFQDEVYHFNLHPLFEQIICADCTQLHKPHPDPLLKCLELLQATPNECIYIGDSIYDFESAKSAGIPFGLAYWGAKKTAGFEQADYIFKQPSHILTAF